MVLDRLASDDVLKQAFKIRDIMWFFDAVNDAALKYYAVDLDPSKPTAGFCAHGSGNFLSQVDKFNGYLYQRFLTESATNKKITVDFLSRFRLYMYRDRGWGRENVIILSRVTLSLMFASMRRVSNAIREVRPFF